MKSSKEVSWPRRNRARDKRKLTAGAVAASLLLASCGGSDDAGDATMATLQLSSLSSRSDMVTGSEAVVEVRGSAVMAADSVSVTLNGRDVTASMWFDPALRRLVGKIYGLAPGVNELVAEAGRGGVRQTLSLTSHSKQGPVFAGPHQIPWVCETESAGLGAPQDARCTVPRKYEWFYRATDQTFKPLASLTKPYPSDVATTTTIDGNTVNFIVRIESGTLDQAVYRIAVLADPQTPSFSPWAAAGPTRSGEGWNGKLNLVYGGSCAPGYRSGTNTLPANLEVLPLSFDTAVAPLGMGFAVAFTSRMSLGNGCDSIRSAENTMMLKEHFIEEYGLPKFTIGSGPSAGSMQQHVIVQAYPGLLDAISVGRSYPDLQSIFPDIVDCMLLYRYFDAQGGSVTADTQAKISGYPQTPTGNTCHSFANGFARLLTAPNLGFSPVVPATAIYQATANPSGARGGLADQVVNVLGIDPNTGFARSTYDNVGVQYGLDALNAGVIDVAQFLDLNAKVGGVDFDGNVTSARTAADIEGITRAYRSGLVFSGKDVVLPIIDARSYVDDRPDIHTHVRTFAKLERLKAANGTAANQVNWLVHGGGDPAAATQTQTANALRIHNEWLESILADTSSASYAQKVIRNKPATAVDSCWDAAGNTIVEPFSPTGAGQCNSLYPIHGNPRIAAGGPLAGDVLKCQLKPVDAADYRVTFDAAQLAQLRAIFPQGVCDWTKPSVGRTDVAPWQRY